jgi:hypothetical protein
VEVARTHSGRDGLSKAQAEKRLRELPASFSPPLNERATMGETGIELRRRLAVDDYTRPNALAASGRIVGTAWREARAGRWPEGTQRAHPVAHHRYPKRAHAPAAESPEPVWA